jgi:hypothetical protein
MRKKGTTCQNWMDLNCTILTHPALHQQSSAGKEKSLGITHTRLMLGQFDHAAAGGERKS